MSKELIERIRAKKRNATDEEDEAADRIEELERGIDAAIESNNDQQRQIEELERELSATKTRLREVATLCAEVEQERDALQADNARLREVVANIAKGDHWSAPRTFQKVAEKALAATPEQSLARLRNQVKEECAELCDKLADTTNGYGCWSAILATKEPT